VPFGPRAASTEVEAPSAGSDGPPPADLGKTPPSSGGGPCSESAPQSPVAAPQSQYAPLSLDAPPSAEDFWGEHSAAVQSALQAPAVPPGANAAEAAVPAIHPRRVARRTLASGAAVLAVAVAVAVIALVSSPSGPGRAPQGAAGSRVGFAAVLSGGVSSILRLDLQRIHVPRVATAKAPRPPHRQSSPTPAHQPARPRPTSSVRSSTPVVSDTAPTTVASSNSYHPTTIDTSAAANAGGTDTHAAIPPATRSAQPRSPSQPVASRATVSATGESGALGPIQSPNG
jgi:hypothetical protein